MFGYVTGNWKELTEVQQNRYRAVYCGICREIRDRSSNLARLGLSYDMAFLALLLMSLYEPEEEQGPSACMLHPIRKRPWCDSSMIRYSADMNVALAYYNFLDDWEDDKNLAAGAMAKALGKFYPELEKEYPRQCGAIRDCLRELAELEKENCPNPDLPANAFGKLMAELMVVKEDLWAPTLRHMGHALGRFIYLMDAAMDYDKDEKKGKYNPFLAQGQGKQKEKWEEYLVLTMGRCTYFYELLPLVQDKALLDNILYSGVWINYRRQQRENGKETTPNG